MLLYQGGVILAPGSYRLKFVAWENDTGRIGTFEEPLEMPLPVASRLGVRLVLLSSQLVPVGKNSEVKTPGMAIGGRFVRSPLEVSGEQIVPSVTNVFTRSQTLYVFFQAYPPRNADPRAVRAGLLFFRNGLSVSRSPLVTPASHEADTYTASFRIRLLLDRLPLGRYMLQAVAIVAGTSYAAFASAFLALVPTPAPPAGRSPAPGR